MEWYFIGHELQKLTTDLLLRQGSQYKLKRASVCRKIYRPEFTNFADYDGSSH